MFKCIRATHDIRHQYRVVYITSPYVWSTAQMDIGFSVNLTIQREIWERPATRFHFLRTTERRLQRRIICTRFCGGDCHHVRAFFVMLRHTWQLKRIAFFTFPVQGIHIFQWNIITDVLYIFFVDLNASKVTQWGLSRFCSTSREGFTPTAWPEFRQLLIRGQLRFTYF